MHRDDEERQVYQARRNLGGNLQRFCNCGVERRSKLTLVVRRETADADVSILLVPPILASRPKGQ